MRTVSFFLLLFALGATATAQDPSFNLTNQAFKAIDRKDFNQAATLLEQAIKANPRNATAHANLGYVCSVLHRDVDALAHSEKAIALDPKLSFAYVNAVVYAAHLSEFSKVKKYGAAALAQPKGAIKPDDLKLVRERLKDLQPRVYTVTWTIDPKNAWGEGGEGKGPFFAPIPATDLPYQTATFELAKAKSHEVVTRDGVRLLKFEADGPVELTAKATVKFVDYRPKLQAKSAAAIPDEAKAYLGKGRRLDPESDRVKDVANKVKGPTPLKTIDNLLVWLKGNMKYEHPTTFESVDEILKRGNGDCGAYSALFVAVCRAGGIPAREVWGVVKSSERFAPPGHLGSHVWAEVYLAGRGWVPVEPQNLNGLGHQPTGYVRLMHFVTLGHDWPITMTMASAQHFGKPATIPKFVEKVIPE